MNSRLVRGAAALAVLAAGGASFGHDRSSNQYKPATKVTTLLSTETTSLGKPIEYPRTAKPEVTAIEVELAPGKRTGWHTHPYPAYGYILSGELTVQAQGGKRFRYEAGEAFAEIVDTPHNGINTSAETVRAVVFFTGQAGRRYTLPVTQR